MPFKPSERLYRSFTASNFQPVEHEDSADSQEPSYRVKGYWTVFNSEYELYPRSKYWPAEYEQIDPHALDEADLSDVLFQENHEGSPLARIRNGSLEVGIDNHGAWCVADLGGCQRGRDVYESIKNGLIVEMSFGFIVDSTDESEGYTTFKDENGDYHTTITRIRKVFDCSCVSIPASPYTEISELRSISAARRRIESERAQAEQPAEERAADAQAAEADGIDYEVIADRVAEIIASRSAQQPADEPEPEPVDEEPSQELIDETLMRRKRRMLALQLIDI